MLELIYTSDDGRSVTFGGPPYYLTGVDGIHGLTADVHSYAQYQQDGVTYVASQLEARDITIKFRLVGDVVNRRIQLLQIASPKVQGTLTLRRGAFERQIRCVIAQAPSFPSQNGVAGTIILFCPQPFWGVPGETRTEIASWEDGIEWDIANGLEFPAEGFTFGNRTPSRVINVFNAGDVPVGFRVVFRALGTLTNPAIVEVDTYKYIRFNTTMEAGDEIEACTVKGQKYAIYRTAAGVVSNAYPVSDKRSDLSLMLDTLDNLYRFEAATGGDLLDVYIYHSVQLLGV